MGELDVTTYELKFIANGEVLVSENIPAGSEITLPTDPTRIGYAFNGWDPEVPSIMPAENQTFTALWTRLRKYLDYAGLAEFKNKLDYGRECDRTEILQALENIEEGIDSIPTPNNSYITLYKNESSLENFIGLFTLDLNNDENIIIPIPESLEDLDSESSIEYIKNLVKYGQTDEPSTSEAKANAQLNYGYALLSKLNIYYNTSTKRIQLRYLDELGNQTQLGNYIDAAAFILDGFLERVVLGEGTGDNIGKQCLIFDFNTDSGITDIEIPLENIFNPDAYYTKEEIESIERVISASLNDLEDRKANSIDLSEVAFSGSYEDLTNKPVIPEEFSLAQSNWTQTDESEIDYIKNKPELATVATSGSYNDLSNTPTIPTVPTNVSAFTNDVPYLTEHQNIDGKLDVIDSNNKLNSDLVDDTNSTNKFVTTEEKEIWNAKSNFSGSYNDLTDTPTIPVNTNLKIKVGNTVFGGDSEIELIAGNNITITPDNSENTITFDFEIDNNNKISANYIDDSTTTNKFVTESDKLNWNNKADKVSMTGANAATENNFFAVDANGNLKDSGYNANSFAVLSGNGKISESLLPSYVDDVIEGYLHENHFYSDDTYTNYVTDESGEIVDQLTGIIFIDLSTNKTYRWSDTIYVEISESLAIGTTTGTAFDGGTGYSHVTNDDIHVTINDKLLWNSKGTITGITMNGSSKGTSGIVDLGTVITDVSDKANQSEMKVENGTGADSDKTTITLKNGTSATVLKSHLDVSNFITKSVDDLVNYYLKSETYTKTEVQTLINAVKQFTYEVAQTLPTATADTMHKIYLVPSSDPQTQNVKDEYITIDNGTEAQTRYTWELIGSTAIDLSGYVTTSDLNDYLLLTGGTLTGNLVLDKGNVANPATIKVYGCLVLDENDPYYGAKEHITIGPDYIRFIDGLSAGDNTLGYEGGVLNYNGIISADYFRKTGGTSSQFLKADGSVDNNTYIKISDITNSVINITDNTTSICNITGVNNSGKNETIIYTNTTSGYDLILTIPSNNYVTPTGYDIELTVPYGGYCEVNYLNIGGTIYARGI